MLDKRFEGIDKRLDSADARFEKFETSVDARFERFETSVDSKLESLDAKVDNLAKDHQILARELSEFRGETRAGLDMLVPRTAEY